MSPNVNLSPLDMVRRLRVCELCNRTMLADKLSHVAISQAPLGTLRISEALQQLQMDDPFRPPAHQSFY